MTLPDVRNEWTVSESGSTSSSSPRTAGSSATTRSSSLAVLVDRFPEELDDVAESLGVVAPPEAEPLGADPVLVRARRPSLDLLVSLCVRITRWP